MQQKTRNKNKSESQNTYLKKYIIYTLELKTKTNNKSSVFDIYIT